MLTYILMFITCVVVTAACVATLYVFFRHLRKIEEQRWGQRKDLNGN